MIELRQFYLGCLAQASYVLAADGVAAVVDPRRDVDQYLQAAHELGARIAYIFETHLHADFVSGHCELAQRTGAQIVLGRRAEVAFPHLAVADGEELAIGSCLLRVLETPGHTPESICIAAIDRRRGPDPFAVFTGDTLFAGDVGRPDLGGAAGAPELAGALYDSLHAKLLTLPDDVQVYPAHGAGSLCGRSMRDEHSSTIGEERRTNAALQTRSREEFVRLLIGETRERPAYFARDVELNRAGAGSIANLRVPQALQPDDLRAASDRGAIVLDVREPDAFGAGHVPGSINIGLSGQFAAWAAALIGLDDEIAVVADDANRAGEARVRLARVGIESMSGYLAGGFAAWTVAGLPVATVVQLPVDALYAALTAHDDLCVLDVRRNVEHAAGHIAGATHIPLDRVTAEPIPLDRARPTAVYCKSGYRSAIASSFMQRAGFARVMNVAGGFDAWLERSLPYRVEALPD